LRIHKLSDPGLGLSADPHAKLKFVRTCFLRNASAENFPMMLRARPEVYRFTADPPLSILALNRLQRCSRHKMGLIVFTAPHNYSSVWYIQCAPLPDVSLPLRILSSRLCTLVILQNDWYCTTLGSRAYGSFCYRIQRTTRNFN